MTFRRDVSKKERKKKIKSKITSKKYIFRNAALHYEN